MTERNNKPPNADVDEVLAALRERPARVRAGHSPIYLWLWRHHGRLREELDPPRRPDWPALAAELGKRGIVDGNGKPPTAERTRKAWWQVSRDKQGVAAGTTRRRRGTVQPAQTSGAPHGQGQAPPLPPGDAASGVGLGMLPPGVEPPQEQPPKYDFQFFKAKDWTKETDKGDE